jgi:endonuclease/exonuclease/phosphatase family metal-dependent hydrolase
MGTSRVRDWATGLGRGGMRAMRLAMALDLLAVAPEAEADLASQPVEANSPERWLRPAEQRAELDRWRDAVGPAAVWAPLGGPTAGAPIDAFHVVVWNTHVGAGSIERIVADLRRGALTRGIPVEHFALLLQEVHRGGDAVPAEPPPGSRSAGSIRPAASPDGRVAIDEVARRAALHSFYVPSMRNGRSAGDPEDRGNAILATFPLANLTAVELPLERERRVAIAADVAGTTTAGTPWRIRLVNLHLDAHSSGMNLHRSFGAGRVRQLQFLLEALRDDDAYTVLGGDFNSWVGGASERALRMPQDWGFVRGTPLGGSTWKLRWFLGILDHVFYRLPPGASAETREIESAYGSDHRPLLGRVRLDPN